MWLSLLTFLSRSKAEAKSVDPLVPSPQPLCSVVKDTLDSHFFDLGSGGKTAVMETRRDAQLRSERREKEDKDPTRGSGVMPGAVGTDAKMGIGLLSSSLNKPTINQYIGVVGGEHSYLERQEREKKDAEELYARFQRRQRLEVEKAWLEVDRLQIEIEDLETAQWHFPISDGDSYANGRGVGDAIRIRGSCSGQQAAFPCSEQRAALSNGSATRSDEHQVRHMRRSRQSAAVQQVQSKVVLHGRAPACPLERAQARVCGQDSG
jgi:hypothetical protein